MGIHMLAIGSEILHAFNEKGWTLYRIRGDDISDTFSQGPVRDILYSEGEGIPPLYATIPGISDPKDSRNPQEIQECLESLRLRGLYPSRLEKPSKLRVLPFKALTFTNAQAVFLDNFDIELRRFTGLHQNTSVDYARLLSTIETDLQPNLRGLRIKL